MSCNTFTCSKLKNFSNDCSFRQQYRLHSKIFRGLIIVFYIYIAAGEQWNLRVPNYIYIIKQILFCLKLMNFLIEKAEAPVSLNKVNQNIFVLSTEQSELFIYGLEELNQQHSYLIRIELN
ncbi:hypothetical protein ABPG72_015137 [Tetrahymena utriculariae]